MGNKMTHGIDRPPNVGLRGAHPNLRGLATFLLLMLMALVSGWAMVGPSPFDYDKARQLSPAKRHEYDVVFFNEMVTWNMNSNRYGAADSDYQLRRVEEFERMAADGHFISYIALRLVDFRRGEGRRGGDAKAALQQLIGAAESGDTSANCALIAIPAEEEVFPYERRQAIARKMKPIRLAQKHGACMAYAGGAMLLGNSPNYPHDPKAAMPLLLEAARQGYLVAAWRLFSLRFQRAYRNEFDFSDSKEVERSLCWGRLAQQHTNVVPFDIFLERLRDYAKSNDRPDLIERSKRFDPRLVPIALTVAKPEDCIKLEQGN